jgi:hypothetical protein
MSCLGSTGTYASAPIRSDPQTIVKVLLLDQPPMVLLHQPTQFNLQLNNPLQSMVGL